MTCIIPDASVILKWVLPIDNEADAALALQLRDYALQGEVLLSVPALWQYEVGNTLARRFPEHAGELLAALVQFEMLEPEPTNAWREATLELTKDFGVTFYDAAYHALALVSGGIFVTADQRYIKKAQSIGSALPLAAVTQLF